MSEQPPTEWQDPNDTYRELISMAASGNRDVAMSLLRELANIDPKAAFPIPLQEYISSCIKKWLATDCDPDRADSSFNVKRSPHRPKVSRAMQDNNIAALRAYYLFRGRRMGRELAIEKTIEWSEKVPTLSKKQKCKLSELSKRFKGRAEARKRKLLKKRYPISESSVRGLIATPDGSTIEQLVALMQIRDSVRNRCIKPTRKRHQKLYLKND